MPRAAYRCMVERETGSGIFKKLCWPGRRFNPGFCISYGQATTSVRIWAFAGLLHSSMGPWICGACGKIDVSACLVQTSLQANPPPTPAAQQSWDTRPSNMSRLNVDASVGLQSYAAAIFRNTEGQAVAKPVATTLPWTRLGPSYFAWPATSGGVGFSLYHI